MKRFNLLVLSFLIITSFYSCDKTIEGDDAINNSTFVEFTINGETYHSENSFTVDTQSGKIGSLASYESTFPEVLTSKYKFSSSIIYLNSDTLFKSSKIGKYRLVQNTTVQPSNLDLSLIISSNDDPSNSNSIRLTTIGTNNVTKTTLYSKSASQCRYIVSGTFSGTYLDTKTNTLMPISGKYRVNMITCRL
jgi:hypothetical protein